MQQKFRNLAINTEEKGFDPAENYLVNPEMIETKTVYFDSVRIEREIRDLEASILPSTLEPVSVLLLTPGEAPVDQVIFEEGIDEDGNADIEDF